MLMLFALAIGVDRFGRQFFGHVEANFIFDDFAQGNIRRAQVAKVANQGPADGAAARVELPHTARDEVDQDVGITDFQ